MHGFKSSSTKIDGNNNNNEGKNRWVLTKKADGVLLVVRRAVTDEITIPLRERLF